MAELTLTNPPRQARRYPPRPVRPVWPGASRRCAEPGFHERATLARVARGTVVRPTRRTREGWRRLSGTRGRAPRTGWAGRTLPTAGRRAPGVRQQVNTARPRPAAARLPTFVRAALPRPRERTRRRRASRNIRAAGAAVRRGGRSVADGLLGPPGSP